MESFASTAITPILSMDRRKERLGDDHDRLEDKASLFIRYRRRASGASFLAIFLVYTSVLMAIVVSVFRPFLILAPFAFVGSVMAAVSTRPRLAISTMAPLTDLKSGLRKGLLPAISGGSHNTLEHCRNFLVEFCEYLLKKDPAIQDVLALNGLISPLLGKSVPGPWYMNMIQSLRSHIQFKILLPLSLTVVSGWFLFIILSLNGFSREAALTPSVETSLGFTGIYAGWLSAQAFWKRKSPD